MRGASLTLGLCLVLSGGSVEVLAQGFDHSSWDHVLKEFVNEQGRVDYAALKASPAELDRYVIQLAAQSPISNPEDFWRSGGGRESAPTLRASDAALERRCAHGS